MSVRPCILIVDPDPGGGGISSRKLVLESARFNVIATYSCEEAMATLERFPRVHAVLLNAVMHETECNTFLDEVSDRYPEPVRVVVGMLDHSLISSADLFVESYSPKLLLEAMQRVFPAHAPIAAYAPSGLERDHAFTIPGIVSNCFPGNLRGVKRE